MLFLSNEKQRPELMCSVPKKSVAFEDTTYRKKKKTSKPVPAFISLIKPKQTQFPFL